MASPLSDIVRNPLKERLARGETATSMIVRISRGPEIGRMAASAGFDSLYVDLEHSTLSLDTTALICTVAREAGVVPLVRVPQIEASVIARVLDAGAMGIVVPHVTSAAQARLAVACAKYPPEGQRSVSSGLALLHYRSFPVAEASAALNAALLVAVMIESTQALACIDDIAAVEGVDLLLVGAGDLCADMGIPGETADARLLDAFEQVLAAASRHGKHVGAGGLAAQPQLLGQLVGRGVRYVSAGTDLAFLASAAADRVRLLKGLYRSDPA
jgi:2-keto-3-deoxy-L-rhamnonate aldolase RhmA